MSSYLWVYGCLASILGSTFSNLGVNVQKYSLMKDVLLPVENQSHHCSQPIWIFGLFLVIFGAIGDLIALSLAAQSIVAPIGSVTLVANIFFASVWLGEKLTSIDIYGTILVISGAVISVVFGDHSDKVYDIADLKGFYINPPYIYYQVFIFLLVVASYFVARYLEPIRDDLLLAFVAYDEAVETDCTEKITLYKGLISDINEKYEPYQKLHPLSYCCLAGIFGSQSVLQAKAVALLFRASISGENQFYDYLTYIFLFLMIVTIVIQTNYLANSLKYFDALYVVPVFQCFWISGSTVGGAIFYGEYKSFSTLQFILFPLGVLITLTGVIILSNREMTRSVKDDDIVYEDSDSDRKPSDRTSPDATAPLNAVHGSYDMKAMPISASTIKIHGPRGNRKKDAPEIPAILRSALPHHHRTNNSGHTYAQNATLRRANSADLIHLDVDRIFEDNDTAYQMVSGNALIQLMVAFQSNNLTRDHARERMDALARGKALKSGITAPPLNTQGRKSQVSVRPQSADLLTPHRQPTKGNLFTPISSKGRTSFGFDLENQNPLPNQITSPYLTPNPSPNRAPKRTATAHPKNTLALDLDLDLDD